MSTLAITNAYHALRLCYTSYLDVPNVSYDRKWAHYLRVGLRIDQLIDAYEASGSQNSLLSAKHDWNDIVDDAFQNCGNTQLTKDKKEEFYSFHNEYWRSTHDEEDE